MTNFIHRLESSGLILRKHGKYGSHQLKMGHQNCINLVLYNNRNKITCMLIDTAIIVLYSVYLRDFVDDSNTKYVQV